MGLSKYRGSGGRNDFQNRGVWSLGSGIRSGENSETQYFMKKVAGQRPSPPLLGFDALEAPCTFPMLIHYPNYTHRIPNASRRLRFRGSNTWKHIWVSLQGAHFRDGLYLGGLYSGFYEISLSVLMKVVEIVC